MKLENFYFARLPDTIKPGRMYRSRFRMPREEIEKRGGVVIEESLEVRRIAETEEDMASRSNTSPEWNAAGQFGKG